MPSSKNAFNHNDTAVAVSAVGDVKDNSLLQLFIRYAWKVEYGECSTDEAKKFMNWVSSKKIDFSRENWPSLLKPFINRDCYYSQDWWIGTTQAIFNELSYKLKNFVPILFKCNDNVNFVDEDGRTILHVFLANIESKTRYLSKNEMYKDMKLVKSLIEQGASVNIVDKRGNTPFHLATMYGQKENVQFMLESFTNIDACDEHENTVLHIVVEKSLTLNGEHESGYADIVRALLCKGADLNKKNKKQLTPLQIAANKYNIEILHIFKENGGDFSLLTDEDETLVLLACRDKWCVKDESKVVKTIDFLVNQGCDINTTDNNGYSPLHYASQWDRAVKSLIELGASIDCRTNNYQQTPLHLALRGYHCNLETIKALVEAGADVNAKAADGATPLLMAMMRSSHEIVNFLIKHGADVHLKENIFGFTPFHLSVFEKEKFLLMIDKGFDVNVTSKHGITPLHLASLAGNREIIKALIDRGADVHCRDKLSQTPLHMVLLGNFFMDLENLLDYAIDKNAKKISFVDEMWSSLWCRYNNYNSKDTIELIVKTGMADVNAKDATGRRPLHLATLEPLGSSVEMLLKLGAQIDVIDDKGRLPLHGVLKNGNERALKLLLDFGMDVNDKGTSSLIINSKKDMKELVLRHLIKRKAAGLPVANVYKNNLNRAKFRRDFSRCCNEVKKLKNHLIDKSGISLYKLLHINWKRRLALIPYDFSSFGCEYEIYQSIIQSSCREAVERKRLLDLAIEAWYRISKYHLLDICVEHIFQYLSNGHLTALIDSAELNCDDKKNLEH